MSSICITIWLHKTYDVNVNLCMVISMQGYQMHHKCIESTVEIYYHRALQQVTWYEGIRRHLLSGKNTLFRNLISNCGPSPRRLELQISSRELSRVEALVSSLNQGDIQGWKKLKRVYHGS